MYRSIQRIRKIYCLIIAIVGVPSNVIAIGILTRGKCGLSNCTRLYLLAMATADLLVIITEVGLNRLNYYYFQILVLYITPVCSVHYVLLRLAIDCSVWFTVIFTLDRFVAICCQKLKAKYCTKKTASIIIGTISTLLCLKNVPMYFRFKPRVVVYDVPFLCSNKPSYFTDPRWIGFKTFEKILTPLTAFGFILVFNALTVRNILVVSRARKRLKGLSKSESHSDLEMASRRNSIILLFFVSGSLLLQWSVYTVYFFEGANGLDGERFYLFENIAYMLRNLNCCTNTLIYVATQSKFREQLKNMVTYPVTIIIKLITKHLK